jgi:biotin carboxyl carrier protein
MYQIKVNDKFNFDVAIANQEVTVNNELITLDSLTLNAESTHVLYNNKSYSITVETFNKIEKTATIKVNGNPYTLVIKDRFDELLKQLGMDNLTANKIQEIKAPMPGLVLNVLVKEGLTVKKGDNILVLEAMKMENILKSPTDGTIKTIKIKQGDKVEKNEILIQFA